MCGHPVCGCMCGRVCVFVFVPVCGCVFVPCDVLFLCVIQCKVQCKVQCCV